MFSPYVLAGTTSTAGPIEGRKRACRFGFDRICPGTARASTGLFPVELWRRCDFPGTGDAVLQLLEPIPGKRAAAVPGFPATALPTPRGLRSTSRR